MSADETITLTDLARLARIGRNAVSNWRRREADFPSPVDDSARRPRFALADVERWAAEHGRTLHITAADRLWFSLQGAFPSADHALQAVASALSGEGDEHRALAERLRELTAEVPASELFEFFIERAREAAGAGIPPGIETLADIAAVCAPAVEGRSVHDPACGEGDLLIGVLATVGDVGHASGRDLSAVHSAVCEQRLRLARPDAEVRTAVGDSLLGPLPERRFDLVVCDPPFNVKDWGYDRLPAGDDPRRAYGTPPRTEPELAWALHCLALLEPDGVAVVRMPAQVAHRRSGRRIRSELLRWGALRAVVDRPDSKAHIWVLAPRAQMDRLLVSTGADFDTAWPAARRGEAVGTEHSATVPLMRLWDEDVDISPAAYLTAGEADADQLAARAGRLAEILQSSTSTLPRFGSGTGETAPETALAELERDGHIALAAGPAAGTGIVVDPLGEPAVRLGSLGAATETQWTIDCSGDAVDPDWLAAVIAARLPTATKRTATGAKRRILSVKVPRIPLAEQRRRGRAFAAVMALRDALASAGKEAAELADEAATGLVNGTVTVDDQWD